RQLHVPERTSSRDAIGILASLAYPDRVGQRRTGITGRFVLRNGRGAALPHAQPLATAEYIVAIDVDDQRPDGRIFVAAPVDLAELRAQFAPHITHEEIVEWDDASERVVTLERERLGELVLRELPIHEPSAEAVRRVL